MLELLPGDPERVGPYRIIGRLGAGGMGRVFAGRSAGGRLVAVKVIRDELASDPDFRARFGREIALARSVSGLFTAPVVDADVDAPVPWLATGYVAGPSLSDAVRDHGPLPAASVRALAAGLAESLRAIHAAGVVHRDLKPTNVLLAEDGPRVIDFGISRAAEASALTHTGLVVGSPGFMSPEQAEGREVGAPSDVFSLGAVLVFAATGQGPFGTGSTAALVYRVVHSPPSLQDVPAQLQAPIGRCLAKEAGQRPTAGELLGELADANLQRGWLPASLTGQFTSYVPPGPGGTQAAVPDARPAVPEGPPTVTVAPRRAEPAATQPPRPGPSPRRRGRRRLAVSGLIAALMAASAAATLALAHPARQTAAIQPRTPDQPVPITTSATPQLPSTTPPQPPPTSPPGSDISPGQQVTTGPATSGEITTVVSTNLSGYSVYPVGGTLSEVAASWSIPPVTCPATGTPRVIVWAGLWGTDASVAASTAWLPRIGTSSRCNNGTASYSAVWEVGNDFPSAAAPAENLQALSLQVSPGDRVSATVTYVGANSAGQREFRLMIADNSASGRQAGTTAWTAVPVPLADIAHQGGAIVEDHNQYGGLANFSQAPISFSNFTEKGGSGGFNGVEYKMVVYGQLLARNSALSGTLGPPPNAESLTVNFLCNGCLAGITCPPPTCLRLPA